MPTVRQIIEEEKAKAREARARGGGGPPKLKQRISRQRRKRLDRDAEYLAVRDIYLEENPTCVRCGDTATAVHHICRGVNRAKSLLNSDSWLGVCDTCHDLVERLSPDAQIRLKQKRVKETIERLRR